MLEQLIELDKELLIYLNGLGSESWNGFFLYITKQLNWWPYFIFLIFLLLKKISPKQFLVLILVLTLFFIFTDQMTNLVKNSVQRIRPLNDPEVRDFLLFVGRATKSWSFFSGHASNSSGSTLILFLVLRRYYKHAFLVFLFPILFAYTRIYLGLHFPGDILAGYLFGLLSGFGFYKLFCYLNNKYGLTDKQNKNAFI